MKLPFKFKFGKKKAAAEDDEDDGDDGDIEDEDSLDEGGDDFDDEGDDEDDGGGGKALLAKLTANKKLLIIGGVGLLILLGGGGGAAWYLFSGDDAGKVAEGGEAAARKGEIQAAIKSRAEPGSPSVEMAVPSKGGGTGRLPGGGLNAIAASSVRGPGAGVMIAATTQAAFRTLAQPPPARPLSPVPNAALVEEGPSGPLPVIGGKGEMPWRVYAAPPPAAAAIKGKGLVAVVVTGLGLSAAVTNAAIGMLPGAVTLAFDPYAPNLKKWVDEARKKGHELLVILPMEPNDFPASDPGPYGLLTANEAAENLRRLAIVLSRMEGYIGVITSMGGRFTPMDAAVRPVVKELKVRGLMIIDASKAPKSVVSKIANELKVPRAVGDVIVADNLSQKNTGRKLISSEGIVRGKSVALVVVPPTPAALKSLSVWAAGLAAKKLALVPASALADKQAVK